MNLADKLKRLQDRRNEVLKSMEALHAMADGEARLLDDDESKTFEELQSEVEALDVQIKQTESLAKLMAGRARPAGETGATEADPSDSNAQRTGPPVARKGTVVDLGQSRILGTSRNLEKGTVFTRYAMALAASKGNLNAAHEIARNNWGKSTPEVASILKAAVAAGTTTDANWAKPLTEYRDATAEFIELLRPETIIGKMNGFRRVPFNIRIPRQTAGSSVSWVGQGSPKPVTKLQFDSVTIPITKVAGIVVITQELARLSQPSAEALVRNDMIETISQFMDEQFIDPTVAPVNGVSPGSITNGVTPIVSSGSTVAQIISDTNAALMQLVTAKIRLTGLYWVMSPRSWMYLSTLRTAQDVYAFPELQNANPTFRGIPVVTSTGVEITDGAQPEDPKTTFIALVSAPEVLMADDGEVLLDVSTEASVAMFDDGAGALTSLWQNNLIGIRAERFAHWMRRRAGVVAVISGVSY